MQSNINNLPQIDLTAIEQNSVDIAQKIVDEQDLDKVKDLTHLFNLNQNKKNVLRILKLNGLLDQVSDQMVQRFEKRPDEFSNADLLNYLQVTQNAIEKANKALNLVDETPAITLQQNNQVNIKVIENLDRDSRDRISDVIKNILKGVSNPTEEPVENIIEIISENTDN